MFIGHYGVSLAAKRWAPRLSLGWTFLAVQLLDVLFASFVLAGIEKMRIVPGFTATNPYDLYSMPYTHGLVGALGWSVLAALVAGALLGGRKAAVAIGVCVFSHWLLDAPMHTPDMPLLGDDSTRIGLGLWHSRGLSIALELVAFGAGALIWLRATGGLSRARVATFGFLAVLAALAVAAPFAPPPGGPRDFAFSALASYFVLAGLAAWVDRRRNRPGVSS
ncbi:MAG TPA: hypothetical protein VNO33_02045 [Kofleriaceae bacterium]|nr:hypothetical protein [Kofleriaceae bacterium]